MSTTSIKNQKEFLLACERGDLDAVRYAVEEKGVDIHANDDRAFRWAAYYGYEDVVKYLVEKGADIDVFDDWINGYARVIRWADQTDRDD